MTAIRHLGIFLCLVQYVSVMGMFTVATPESTKRLTVNIVQAENEPVVDVRYMCAAACAIREGIEREYRAAEQARHEQFESSGLALLCDAAVTVTESSKPEAKKSVPVRVQSNKMVMPTAPKHTAYQPSLFQLLLYNSFAALCGDDDE